MAWKCNVFGGQIVHYVQKCTWWPLTSITTYGQIAEQVKNAQETLGYQKIIVPKIPPGGEGGGYCQLKVYKFNTRNISVFAKTDCVNKQT